MSPAKRQIEAFEVIVRGSATENSTHAMLSGYFDDSSDPTREQYFAVGGIIGLSSKWKRFMKLKRNRSELNH